MIPPMPPTARTRSTIAPPPAEPPAGKFRPVGEASGSLAARAAEVSAARRGRDYQVELARDAVSALEHPIGRTALEGPRVVSSCLAVLPTGAGKTQVALSVAEALQLGAGLRVGWVAARRELLRQAREEVRAFGFQLDMRTISLFDRCPPQVDLLIVDEAHRDSCRTAANLCAKARPSHVLGLTATPWRTDRARLAFAHELRRCTIPGLIADGYLSEFASVTIDAWDPAFVARTWLRDRARFGPTIIFFQRAAEARACVAELLAGGARADLVCGSSDRASQLEAFEARSLDVLVAMSCLNEGFSAPWLRTVFVRPASKGPVVQMGGRVLRPCAESPLKLIVQPRSAPIPFSRIAAPREQYLLSDGNWRSLGATRDLDAICARMRSVLARSPADAPGLFGKSNRGRVPPAAVRGFRTGFASTRHED